MKKLYATALTAGLVMAQFPSLDAATATLEISGTVTAVASVSVTPTALATSLTIAEGVVNQKIATVNEKSNNLLGYVVTLSSANAVAASSSTPTLVRSGGGGEAPIYSLTYNSLPVVFVAGLATVTPLGVLTDTSGVDRDVNITIVPGQVFTAGTYTDTLTLTLTNN